VHKQMAISSGLHHCVGSRTQIRTHAVSNYACLRDCYSAAILHLPENSCGIHKFTARELKWNGME